MTSPSGGAVGGLEAGGGVFGRLGPTGTAPAREWRLWLGAHVGLPLAADNVPSFARRSVLVSRETMIPYHERYFRHVRARALDLLRAEYSSDPRALADVVRRYRVDYFLVESDGFTASAVRAGWIREFHPLSDAIARDLERGRVPVLAGVVDRCAVLRERELVVLAASCVVATAEQDAPTGAAGAGGPGAPGGA